MADFEALAAELSAESLVQNPSLSAELAGVGLPPDQASPVDLLVPRFTVMHSGGEVGAEGFVNLGAELEEELAAEERTASPPVGGGLVEDLLREFQKGVREQLDEKDFETHYNLGIAYKEMDLYDEAIQEFRLAALDPGRILTCANLLGLCYLAKGNPDAAIRELRAGLEVRGHPRGAYHGLRYDLGAAYETAGDLGRALESFEALHAEDARFRDVRARVSGLRERLRQRAASVPTSPVQTGEALRRVKEKKISFI
jgi:tetratricopeptide (TPR) repeat protein